MPAARPELDLHWYHTIDLAPGRETPGFFDTRPVVGRVPLPRDLTGRRCLDVGSWDGFWAFEMERRGAASVTAIDVADAADWDWPAVAPANDVAYLRAFKAEDAAFRLAHSMLGSRVERLALNVYDLDPAVHGTFDTVYLGSLLLHLRDPVRALERVRAVTRGEVVIVDTVDAFPSFTRPRTPSARLDRMARPWWWTPNVAGLRQMVRRAGLRIVERTGVFLIPLGAGHPRIALRTCNPLSARGREQALLRWRGIPHSAVRAVP